MTDMMLLEIAQTGLILNLMIRNTLLRMKQRRLEQKLLDLRVDTMAESIRQALEPQLRAWGLEKEDNDGLSAE